MKRSPLSRYTPIKKSRSKPRAGRVKGKDMEALRRACFERDGYRCQGAKYRFNGFVALCNQLVTWESGHMHHLRNKRMWGDTLDNVTTLCPECHTKEHNCGGKPIKISKA